MNIFIFLAISYAISGTITWLGLTLSVWLSGRILSHKDVSFTKSMLVALPATVLYIVFNFVFGMFLFGLMQSVGTIISLVIPWFILLPLVMKLFDIDSREAIILILVTIGLSIPLIIGLSFVIIFILILVYLPLMWP